MPIIKNAIKKQRVDKKRTKVNAIIRFETKGATKAAKAKMDTTTITRLYSALDKAVSKKIIKLNKASRIKARILKAMKIKGITSPF